MPWPIDQGWHKKPKNPGWVFYLGFFTQRKPKNPGFKKNVPFVNNVNSILSHNEFVYITVCKQSEFRISKIITTAQAIPLFG